MNRLRSMIVGSRQLFIPILPKPAPTAIPANIGVATASSKNTVTSVATPTNHQLSGYFGNHLMSNLPVLDLSSSSIVVAQTKSTPPVQNSGNMVTQGSTSLNESTLSVSSSWNSIAQGPSPASVSRTESRPVVDSSVNMVTQSQLPEPSTVVSQISSTPSVSGNMVAQSPLPLTTSVTQTASRPLLQNSANMMQPMLATVSQTASSQQFRSSVNVVPEGQLPSLSETANQPMLSTPNASLELPNLSGDEVEVFFKKISGDTKGNLDTNENRNMLVMDWFPRLNTSPNASEIVQREQHTNIIANSSNLQVL